MQKFSTEQVAKLLGLNPGTLSRYIKTKKIVAPEETMVGAMKIRLWTEEQVERLRDALPKIANGRKTRYQKQRQTKQRKKKSKQ